MITAKRYIIDIAVDIIETSKEEDSGGIVVNWAYRYGGLWLVTMDRFSARLFKTRERAESVAKDHYSYAVSTVREVKVTIEYP